VLRWLAAIVVLALALPAHAHELTVSVMSVKQVGAHEFVTSWERVEGLHDPRVANLVLQPRFPAQCTFTPPSLHCDDPGLVGRLRFEGLATYLSASVIVHVQRLHGPAESYTATGGDPTVNLRGEGSRDASSPALALAFTKLGVEHIWFGWDHLAFVLGLLLLVQSRAMLVKTITAFTIAHSLTLGAATLGIQTLPGPPIEAAIALSIALLAVELVKERRDGIRGLTGRAPWLVAFGFGLLHGFGFAGALAEIAIPAEHRLLALGFFNVGVELGQLVFVAVVSLGVRMLERSGAPWLRRGVPLVHYGMGTLAAYWVTERVVAFWG
jgi:hydrogenase/urease accessory protein HupE